MSQQIDFEWTRFPQIQNKSDWNYFLGVTLYFFKPQSTTFFIFETFWICLLLWSKWFGGSQIRTRTLRVSFVAKYEIADRKRVTMCTHALYKLFCKKKKKKKNKVNCWLLFSFLCVGWAWKGLLTRIIFVPVAEISFFVVNDCSLNKQSWKCNLMWKGWCDKIISTTLLTVRLPWFKRLLTKSQNIFLIFALKENAQKIQTSLIISPSVRVQQDFPRIFWRNTFTKICFRPSNKLASKR